VTQLLLNLRPEQQPSLDNFVAGANGELVGRLRDLAAPGSFANVYLWGPPGAGKSHLLAATAALAESRRPVVALTGADAGDDMSIEPGGLLVVDDVHRLGEEAQVALFRIFNTARLVGLSLLLAGSEPPRRLALREDLRTRVGQCLVYEVKGLSDDEKSAALRRHALERGLRVDEGLVRYLLSRSRRDLPSLMAVLDHLDRKSLEQLRPATLPLLKEVLELQFDDDNEPRPI
jgi:DnaA family protein